MGWTLYFNMGKNVFRVIQNTGWPDRFSNAQIRRQTAGKSVISFSPSVEIASGLIWLAPLPGWDTCGRRRRHSFRGARERTKADMAEMGQ